jgi:hypothetical protein
VFVVVIFTYPAESSPFHGWLKYHVQYSRILSNAAYQMDNQDHNQVDRQSWADHQKVFPRSQPRNGLSTDGYLAIQPFRFGPGVRMIALGPVNTTSLIILLYPTKPCD